MIFVTLPLLINNLLLEITRKLAFSRSSCESRASHCTRNFLDQTPDGLRIDDVGENDKTALLQLAKDGVRFALFHVAPELAATSTRVTPSNVSQEKFTDRNLWLV